MSSPRGRLPIAASKFGCPAVAPHVVGRPRLIDMLAGDDWRVALVTGGPASGKTVMAAQWFEACEGVAREWVTLDSGDDRPERFWLALAVALDRAVPGGFGGAVELAADARRGRGRFLDELLIEMSALAGPLVLVLDDVHILRDRAIVADLASMVERLPRGVRLVFTGRADAPLPVARWRARSWLVEIRQHDLAFTLAETGWLFAALDEHRLGSGEMEDLWRRTEGWVAGLRLAAAAVRDDPDVSAAAAAFSGRDRMVADLLVSEILDRQPPELAEFLLCTSIADVVDGAVGDALTGRGDSAAVLRGLEADVPFLAATSAERSSYRYHPLLAEMLRSELEARHPGLAPKLHRLAGDVLAAGGDVVAAVGHFLAAGETDRAFSLISVAMNERTDHGDLSAAAAWIDLFPAELVAGSTARMLTYVFALALVGRTDECLAWIERVELRMAADPDPPAEDIAALDAIRLVAFAVTGAAHDGIAPGHRAVEAVDRGLDLGRPRERATSNAARAFLLRVRPTLARAYLLVDQPDEAERALTEGPVGEEFARLVLAPGVAARIAWRRGQLAEAEQQARRAYAGMKALGMNHPGILDAILAQAGALTDRNELTEAEAVLQRSDQYFPTNTVAVVYQVLVGAHRVRVAAGRADPDAAFALLERMRRLNDGRRSAPLQVIIDTVAARCHLEAGQIEQAEELIGGLPVESPAGALMAARLDLARGRPGNATTRLASTEFPTLRDRLNCEVILARAAVESGAPGAEQHMAKAVELAASEGFVRVFLEEGPIATGLARAATAALTPPSGAQLAAALGVPPRPRPAGQSTLILSERDRAVLRLLPSELTYQEIASECFMSINTVKTHLKSIYAKLGVSSRTGAVERARLLGLL